MGSDSGAGASLNEALRRGLWSKACSIATNVLTRKESDIDALGVFTTCEALNDNKTAAANAVTRLETAELPPRYYTQLARSILSFKAGAPDRAQTPLHSILRARPNDPLALYFIGAIQHVQHSDAKALANFRTVLETWPDYAPALIGAAQILAAGSVEKPDIDAAIAMTKRATAIEPMNLAYWRVMADLYERKGEHAQAQAVMLQWLTKPPLYPKALPK